MNLCISFFFLYFSAELVHIYVCTTEGNGLLFFSFIFPTNFYTTDEKETELKFNYYKSHELLIYMNYVRIFRVVFFFRQYNTIWLNYVKKKKSGLFEALNFFGSIDSKYIAITNCNSRKQKQWQSINGFKDLASD